MGERALKIAVASGKGGTGKTTVSLGLAAISNRDVTLIDCDVEEPNVHLFTSKRENNSEALTNEPVSFECGRFSVEIPAFNENLCTGCGICKTACFFNAITILGNTPLFFPELCHSCGSCFDQCPCGALTIAQKDIGEIRQWRHKKISFIDGCLNIGEAKSPPLIKHIKKIADGRSLIIIDCPPGTSCPFVAAVNDTDYVILVSEPTPFGLNDLKLAVETLEKLGMKFGIVINKADSEDNIIKDYCVSKNTEILGQIPLSKEIAGIYSQGKIPAVELRELRSEYEKILEKAIKEATK